MNDNKKDLTVEDTIKILSKLPGCTKLSAIKHIKIDRSRRLTFGQMQDLLDDEVEDED